MTQIELRGVQKFFGAVQVLQDVNLTIEDGEFVGQFADGDGDQDGIHAGILAPVRAATGCVA